MSQAQRVKSLQAAGHLEIYGFLCSVFYKACVLKVWENSASIFEGVCTLVFVMCLSDFWGHTLAGMENIWIRVSL